MSWSKVASIKKLCFKPMLIISGHLIDCPLLFLKHRRIWPIKYNYSFKSFNDKSAIINDIANIDISDADTLPMK